MGIGVRVEEFRASKEPDIDYVIACGAPISVRKADIAASHNYRLVLRYFYNTEKD